MTDAQYTSVDLNATGTTTIFDGDEKVLITGVHLRNGGGTAVANLEVTDGSDTATLVNNRGSGGSDIHYENTFALARNDDLQINVTTAEGAAQSNTAVVLRGEPGRVN